MSRECDDIRVKSLSPRNVYIPVEARLYDPPQHEEEVGEGPHEFRMVGRIVEARSAEQSDSRVLTPTSCDEEYWECMGDLPHGRGNRMEPAEAYFTVEAAMVLPCVLAVIVTVIYLLFYQYDRCLMEQELGLLMLEAYAAQTADAEELVTLLQSESAEENYCLALEAEDLLVGIRGRRIRLSRSGNLQYPFAGFLSGASEDSWGICAQTTGYKILPVNFIRNYRKILGGT